MRKFSKFLISTILMSLSATAMAEASIQGNCKPIAYPAALLESDISGVATIDAIIGSNGKAIDSKILKSSGSDAIDYEALNAVKQCKFTPEKYVMGPAPKRSNIIVEFKIN